MRIATFNTLHGQPACGGEVDLAGLQAAAATLDADVLAVQELDHHHPRSGQADQLALIGAALEAPYRRFVAAWHARGDQPWTMAPDEGGTPGSAGHGIGLVSRLPVRHWQVLRFAPAPARLRMPLRIPGRPGLVRTPDEPRAALAAVIDGPTGPFTVITAHLSIVPGWNARQLYRISRWALTLPAPRLLLGDFNLPGPLPRLITGWQPVIRAATYPADRPRVQFDHVLADGLNGARIGQAGVVRLPVSDHCALAVELDMHRSAAVPGPAGLPAPVGHGDSAVAAGGYLTEPRAAR